MPEQEKPTFAVGDRVRQHQSGRKGRIARIKRNEALERRVDELERRLRRSPFEFVFPPLPPEFVADVLDKIVMVSPEEIIVSGSVSPEEMGEFVQAGAELMEQLQREQAKRKKQPSTWYEVVFEDDQRPHKKRYSLEELEQGFSVAVKIE